MVKDRFVVSVYCGPQPPIEVDGKKYPDRIVKEQYRLLKDLGINTVYGQCDIFNSDTDEYALKALGFCEELSLDYYVKDLIAREYCSLGETMFKRYRFKDFRLLSEREKQNLDERFRLSLRRYKNSKAFKGIIFVDEPGYEMFEGIRRAKAVFDSECGDKTFLVNHLHHCCSPELYQFSFQPKNEPVKKEFEFFQDKTQFKYDGFFRDNLLERYETFIDFFFQKVDAKVFSWDLYPFFEYRGIVGVDKGIYTLPQLAFKMREKYGAEFWTFLQCGGKWEDSRKVTSFADVQLSVSVAVATGAKGLQLYTGCFSNDCLPRIEEISGVIDEYGQVTNQYDFYRYALRQVKAIEKYIISAQLKGIIASGEYYDGNPDVDVLRDELVMNDVYKGKFPPYAGYELTEYKELVGVDCKNQVLVSCFDNDGKSVFMAVNSSPVIATSVRLKFDGEYEFLKIESGIVSRHVSNAAEEISLPAGENFVIVML